MSSTTATAGSTTRTIAPSVMRRSWRSSGGSMAVTRGRSRGDGRGRVAVADELALARRERRRAGRTAARPPAARRRAPRGHRSRRRSSPASSAVVTSSWAWSVRELVSLAATVAPRKSMTPNSSPSTIRCRSSSWPWAMPARCNRSRTPTTARRAGSAGSTGAAPSASTRPVRCEHEQGVIAGGRARRDDGVGQHPRLTCEQRQERLVLDLLEAAETHGRSRLAVPDRPPQRREQRGVVGVAPVDLDDERLTRLALGVHEELSSGLTVGGSERADRHPQLGERAPDRREARTTGARTEHEVHGRCGDHGGEQSRDGAERRGCAEHRDGEGADAERPSTDATRGRGDVGRGRHHDRPRGSRCGKTDTRPEVLPCATSATRRAMHRGRDVRPRSPPPPRPRRRAACRGQPRNAGGRSR